MSDNKNQGNTDEYEKYCMLCHRSEQTAGKMIELPGGICVCPDCMQKAFDTMKATGLSYQEMANMTEQLSKLLPPDMVGAGSTRNVAEGTADSAAGSSDAARGLGNGAAANAADAVENGRDGTQSVGGSRREGADAGGSGDGGKDPDGKPDEPSNQDGQKNIRIPTISMINLGDLFGNFGPPRQQQTVKKKKKTKQAEPHKEIDIQHLPAPHKIKASLDEYVIGQDYAKKVISVAVYNHYKRIASLRQESVDDDGIEIEKSNMLLLGPTGCGKTYLVKTLARLLDVPLAIADATSLTEAGYIGDDIESVVSRLLAAADNDVERAEQGIIFIDEIDKIARKKNANQRDVSGEAVQQGMLKLLEGSEVEVPVGAASKNAMVPMATVDTSNILFICGGAFPGLEDIIKERLNKQSSIGFLSDLKDKYDEDPDILTRVTVEDLRSFGMIPEFLGRLPIICALQSLTKEMLVRILKEPRNAIIRQYQKLLALDEVELTLDDEALEAIAEKALEKKTGARALRAILEEFMLDIMYEIPKDDNIGSVRITREYIEHTGGPVISLRATTVPLLEGK